MCEKLRDASVNMMPATQDEKIIKKRAICIWWKYNNKYIKVGY